MRRFLAFIFLFLLLGCLRSAANEQTDTLKVGYAVRITTAPKIDGMLNDEVWNSAPAISGFVMNRPVEGGEPSLCSEVKILYDDAAIYVGAMLYDHHPDSILRELGNRDNFDLNADYFRFIIDPYNLRQDAFDFGVWASGVQTDSKFSDYTFNAVWSSAVKITPEGWSVEMAIPYSAIRFPKKPVQEWAMQATRNIRRTREFNQWSLTPSTAANSQLYWGTLRGIESIRSPVRLSLTPYVSAYMERSPDYLADNTYHYSNSFSYNAGADIKYGIDDRFTLDMTLLPDFGQVQSDNKVKNLSYQEVTYSEYRSFFKEGTDIFSKNGLFYTRRIGRTPALFYSVPSMLNEGEELESNPSKAKLLNAFKISGRTDKGLGIGLFNAVTDNMYARIKDIEGNSRKILTEPLTNYNVAVVDKQFGSYSKVYFINTNVSRTRGYASSDVSAAGFTLADKKKRFATDGMFGVSQTAPPPDKGTLDIPPFGGRGGYRYFAGVRKISGNLQYGISHSKVSDTYNQLDLGYYIVPNIENTNAYINYFWHKPWKGLLDRNISISSYHNINPLTGKKTSFGFNAHSYAVAKSYHSFFAGGGWQPWSCLDYNEPRIAGRFHKTIPYWWSYAGISSDYRKALAVDFTLNVSNFIGRYIAEGYNYNMTLRYRFSDRLTLKLNNNFNTDPYNFGVADYSDPAQIIYGLRRIRTYENNLSGKYIFKNDMALTLNARHYWSTGAYRRYFLLFDDGEVGGDIAYGYNNDFSYNVFNIDVVYSWQFAPGSNLSVAYKNAIETSASEIPASLSDNFSKTLRAPQLNSFSVKVLYYLDYLKVVKKKA